MFLFLKLIYDTNSLGLEIVSDCTSIERVINLGVGDRKNIPYSKSENKISAVNALIPICDRVWVFGDLECGRGLKQ